jgi:N-acetylneuraminic acid mutarotase
MTTRIRNASAALLFLVCLVTLTSAFNLPNRSPPDLSSRLAFLRTAAKPAQQHTILTLADRVAYERAIEEVYWRHRIWPRNRGERPDPKPSLDKVMPSAQLEKKVEDYLRNSQALDDYWKEPLSAEQLQAEMERMAQHTKQPEVLRELFATLGNDPFVIAECLARPALSERLVTNLYAHDQRFHGELRQRAEADLRAHPSVRQMKQTSGRYSKIELVRSDRQDEENRGAERGLTLNSDKWNEEVQKLAATANYALPTILGGVNGCTDDTWTATSTTNAPAARQSPTAVWTGSEMIIWSGGLNTGGRYNPATDSWLATTTTNAPSPRNEDSAIWTGSEMIVWGGSNSNGATNTGARYNPSTDSWVATSTTGAPASRYAHTAVWTGSEMIVWGGNDSLNNELNTGGRYNPSTDTWTTTSTTNAPDARSYHTAVWTGNEMIIWSGGLNTGGRYNPATDSWLATTTTNAPSPRDEDSAIWTGSEMIVWGGQYAKNLSNTGARYNPSTDSWVATSTSNVPTARRLHTAVWTGSEMIVWGGVRDSLGATTNTGGRYNPTTDRWTATSTNSAPSGRADHAAVWTGSEMIVWGGVSGGIFYNTGGRYCAQTAPMPQSEFSRKTHGAAGIFDLPLPVSGPVGVECRSGGVTNDYQMIINFMTNVTVQSASVTSGTGTVSSFSVSGPQVTVNLSGVTNVQRITVTLFNAKDGTHMGNVPVSMGVLIGDVNGTAIVNASDVSLTKAQVGQPVTGSNFREDVNANGTISATDVSQVKANVGTALPP